MMTPCALLEQRTSWRKLPATCDDVDSPVITRCDASKTLVSCCVLNHKNKTINKRRLHLWKMISHPNLKFYSFVRNFEGFHAKVNPNCVYVTFVEHISCFKSSHNTETVVSTWMNGDELQAIIIKYSYQLFPTAQSPISTTLNSRSKSSLMIFFV